MLCRSLENNVENSAEDGGLACEISEGKLKTLFRGFDEKIYLDRLERLFCETEMVEDGKAAEHVADVMEKMM